MSALTADQKIWAPNPEGDGEVRAVFHEVIVDDPIEVNGVLRDRAWVSWDDGDGTTFKAPFFQLRPRDE